MKRLVLEFSNCVIRFEQKISGYLMGFYRSAESAIEWMVEVDQGPIVLSPNAVLNLFRIIQESSNNTLKYAHASTQKILIKVNESGSLTLEIKDNGKGFVVEAFANAMEHNGLKNMKYRAESLGGSCVINSVVGKGTAILVTLPLEQV